MLDLIGLGWVSLGFITTQTTLHKTRGTRVVPSIIAGVRVDGGTLLTLENGSKDPASMVSKNIKDGRMI